MGSVNKVFLVGRLGKDPELKYFDSGDPVCNFSMATSRKYKNKSGELQEETEWHRVAVWGKSAEACGQYLAKGREAHVEGRLKYRQYEQDGVTKYATDIVASQVTFLGSKSDAAPAPAQDAPAQPPPPAEDEKLPF